MKNSNIHFLSEVVFIDGLTRSGKSLLAPLLQYVDGMDNIQILYPLEHLIGGVVAEKVEVKYASQFILKMINERIYDAFIGRNQNNRFGEITSIERHRLFEQFQNRKFLEEGDSVLQKLKIENLIFPFFTHELMAFADKLRDLELGIPIIEMIRNPSDVVFSWYKKGWGYRQLSDPRSFKLVLESEFGYVPWQVLSNAKDWIDLNEMDRCIYQVIFLMSRLLNNIEKNSYANMMFVFYDDLITSPTYTLEKIGIFLKRKLNSHIFEIFNFLNLPRPINLQEREEKLLKIKSLSSTKSFQELESFLLRFKEFSLKKLPNSSSTINNQI